ncbi:MAG: M20/M25/M40 family metallo-hydrolase, partial [Planctomycetota bacterium]
MTCTEGYRKAADWVAARFKAWGLKPAGEEGTYFQKVSIRGFDWNTGVPSLKVGAREFLYDDGDYSVHSASTPATTVSGEIVFVGYGIAAPKKGLDEYEGVNVKGKIVLVLRGNPKDAPQPRRMFGPRADAKKDEKKEDPWKDESTDQSKIKTAYEKDAAAIMLYGAGSTTSSSTRRRYSSRSSPRDSFKPERNFLCFTIQERVFRAIMKHDPQESPGGLKRRMDAVRRQIKEKKAQSRTTGVRAMLKGYDVSIRYDEKHGNNVARNVLAKIEGTDPNLKSQYVITGAHLDHVGVRRGYVYNGADDNASGSAVVMEVARTLAESNFRPKRTLIFCCWCGEERGLLGSYHYASKPCDGVATDNVVAYFNIDMVGMGDVLGAPGALNFPTIWNVIKRDQDPKIIKKIKPSQGGPGGSDHTPFIKRGIEALALMSREGVGHQDYHQPEDDTQKIEPEMLRVTGQFVLQGMVNLANETKVNLLIDKRQQLYRAMRMQISNLNPDLKDSSWSYVEIKKKTKEELYDEVHDHARELFTGSRPPGDSDAASKTPRAKKSLTRGLANLKPIGADTRLLELAVDCYGIVRVDLKGDDGVWIVDGRLTDDGRDALKTLEANDVVVR